MLRNNISILTSSNGAYVIQLEKNLRRLGFKTHIANLKETKARQIIDVARNKLKHHGLLSFFRSLCIRSCFFFARKTASFSKFDNLAGFFSNLDPNSLVVLYNTGLIPADLLQKNRQTPILVAHPSYLPHGRGFDGTRQAILQGVRPGVSVLEIDEGIDTGSVWNQGFVDLNGCTSMKSLRQRQSSLSQKLTADSCLQWREDSIKKTKLPVLPIIRLKQEDRNKADQLLLKLMHNLIDNNLRHT